MWLHFMRGKIKRLSQKGTVLILVLIILFSASALALAALEAALLQTKMSTYDKDYWLAFEKAEAGLINGENKIQQGDNLEQQAGYCVKKIAVRCGVVYYRVEATGKYGQVNVQLQTTFLKPVRKRPDCYVAKPIRLGRQSWKQGQVYYITN